MSGSRLFRAEMTPQLRDFLQRNHIIPKSPGVRMDHVKRIVIAKKAQVSQFTRHHFTDGTMNISPLGYMSYCHGFFPGEAIGAFCSIARGVALMGDDHPMDRVTSHSFTYEGFYSDLVKKLGGTGDRAFRHYDGTYRGCTIGNDVWIGGDVLIKNGVAIGDGAVIAARSVVTKDVAPFTIVGGSPARPIRLKFPEPVIERLSKTSWWNYDVRSLAELDMSDPERFCDEFESRRDRLQKADARMISAIEIAEAAGIATG